MGRGDLFSKAKPTRVYIVLYNGNYPQYWFLKMCGTITSNSRTPPQHAKEELYLYLYPSNKVHVSREMRVIKKQLIFLKIFMLKILHLERIRCTVVSLTYLLTYFMVQSPS